MTRTANKATTEITSYSSEYLSDRRTRAVLADSVSARKDTDEVVRKIAEAESAKYSSQRGWINLSLDLSTN